MMMKMMQGIRYHKHEAPRSKLAFRRRCYLRANNNRTYFATSVGRCRCDVGHLENGLDDSTANMCDLRGRYGHLSHTHDQKEAGQTLSGRLAGDSGPTNTRRRYYQGHVGDDYERQRLG